MTRKRRTPTAYRESPRTGTPVMRAAEPKRSKHLRLALMGTAVAVPVAIALWPDRRPDSGVVLETADQCRHQPLKVTPAECEQAYAEALAKHQSVAPRFESEFQCEEQFRACDPLPQDAAYAGPPLFIPGMAGFLVGYRAPRPSERGGGYYGYGGSLPLYRERGGDFYNPGGDYLRDSTGPVKGTKGLPLTPARAVTVSRSGFGSSSAARSSFGGRGFGG